MSSYGYGPSYSVWDDNSGYRRKYLYNSYYDNYFMQYYDAAREWCVKKYKEKGRHFIISLRNKTHLN
jgi:hypothetical protein